MSTRSQILFEGHGVAVYRHNDGYPDGECGVLADLLPLLAEFSKYRGWDPFYLAAQVVHRFVAVYQADYDARVAAGGSSYPEIRFLGFGVEPFDGGLHGDTEFVYLVRPDHVEVRSGADHLADTELLRRVQFNGNPYRLTRAKRAAAEKRAAADPAAYALTRTDAPKPAADAARPTAASPAAATRRVDL